MKSRISLAVVVAMLCLMLIAYMGSILKSFKARSASSKPTLKVALKVDGFPTMPQVDDPPPGEDTGTVSEDQVG